MSPPSRTLPTALAAVLLLAGCSAPKSAVKLSGQTRRTVNALGSTYVADLEQIRIYDARRTDILNAQLREYDARRRDIVRVYEEAFTAAKDAAQARLLQQFDGSAQELLTRDFWLKLRTAFDAQRTRLLIEMQDQAEARQAELADFPCDRFSQARATLTLRTNALVSALIYQTTESAFADLAERVSAQRREFQHRTEERFRRLSWQPAGTASNEPAPRVPSESTAVFDRRIAEVEKARAALDSAFAEMDAYLSSSKWPWKDLLQGVLEGLVGLSDAGQLSSANLLGLAEAAGGLDAFPDFADLSRRFATGLTAINREAGESAQEGEQLLAAVRSQLEPTILKPVTAPLPAAPTP